MPMSQARLNSCMAASRQRKEYYQRIATQSILGDKPKLYHVHYGNRRLTKEPVTMAVVVKDYAHKSYTYHEEK